MLPRASGLKQSYATSKSCPTGLNNFTLHHLVLAVKDGPPDPGHLFLRRQIGPVLCEWIRQVAGVHLSQLLKVTEGCGEVPVLSYQTEWRREVTLNVWMAGVRPRSSGTRASDTPRNEFKYLQRVNMVTSRLISL